MRHAVGARVQNRQQVTFLYGRHSPVSGEEVASRAAGRNPYASSREPFVTGSLGGHKALPHRHKAAGVNEEDEFEDD